MRVLIVEDELRMASLIRRGLVNEGLAADLTGKGAEALWLAQAHPYDAVVLDVMLPDLDGFEVCRRLRRAGVWSPVLMLTAARLGFTTGSRASTAVPTTISSSLLRSPNCSRGYVRLNVAAIRNGPRSW